MVPDPVRPRLHPFVSPDKPVDTFYSNQLTHLSQESRV